MIVNIKGRDYNIEFSKNVFVGGDKVDGYVRYFPAFIEIDKNNELFDILDTVAHELFHAYFHECGLREEQNNEALVSWLGFHLFDIFKSWFSVVSKLNRVLDKDSISYANYLNFMKECKKMFNKCGVR